MTPTVNEAFKPTSNSIGFLRWALAFAVIFSHAGPIGGFYHGEDLGTQISKEQSLGGVAVAGFFFVSGFLITRSRMGRATIFRFFWRRVLRIFPAFWACLLITGFIFGPLAWWRTNGTFAGYFSVSTENPLTYFPNNMFLMLHQRNIAGIGQNLPYAQLHGAFDWNGSAWTLIYEFKGYLLIGLLGLFGFLAHRYLAGAVALALIVLNTMLWAGMGNIGAITPFLGNFFNIMFMAPFAFGILFALFGHKIKIDDRVAVAALGAAIFAYSTGGWNIWGQFGFCYFIMWCAVRLPIRNWEKRGDLSYGIYIYAWPLMTLGAYFGLEKRGWLVYHIVIIVGVHIMAYLSWHLIEAPAMSLKNWTPKPLAKLQQKCSPAGLRIKKLVVNPNYSSTRFATTLLEGRAAAATDQPELVSELPSDRVHARGEGQADDVAHNDTVEHASDSTTASAASQTTPIATSQRAVSDTHPDTTSQMSSHR